MRRTESFSWRRLRIIATWILEQHDSKVLAEDINQWKVHFYSIWDLRVLRNAVKFLTS